MPSLTLGPCARRSTIVERIDAPDVSDADLDRLHAFHERAMAASGLYHSALSFLQDASRRWAPNQTITVLDLFCGRGRFSRELAAWAARRPFDVHILAVDRYGRVIELAKDRTDDGASRIIYDVRDWNHPAFLHAQQFDYVVSLGGFHRVEDAKLVPFLKKADLLAKRGVFVADWIRDIRAWSWMSCMATVGGRGGFRREARLAVERGVSTRELRRHVRDAQVDHLTLRAHLGLWFSLSGERGFVMEPKLAPAPGLAPL